MDTYSTIAPFMVGDYGLSSGSINGIASKYDFVWNSLSGNASHWLAGNASMDVSYYIPSGRDDGTFGNSDALQTLSWWQSNHPDWVLYKSDQTTPAYDGTDPNVPLDQSNSAVVSWQTSTYASPVSASGHYTMLSADNVDLRNYHGAVGVFRSGVWTPLYSGSEDDSAFATMVVNWVSAMYTQVKALSPALKFVVNLGGCGDGNPIPFTDSKVVSIVQNSDAILDEQGVTQLGAGLLSGSNWLTHIQFAQAVQQTYGKTYYMINQLPASDIMTVQYCVASYLMGKYHASSIYLLPPGGSYGIEHYYDQFTSWNTIGTPQEDMALDGNVYRRRFSGGIVLCNPDASHTYTYSYQGRTYTLPPVSGLVLTNFRYGGF